MTAAGIFEGARSLSTDESADRFLRRFDGDPAMRATTEAARGFVEGFEAAPIRPLASAKGNRRRVGNRRRFYTPHALWVGTVRSSSSFTALESLHEFRFTCRRSIGEYRGAPARSASTQ